MWSNEYCYLNIYKDDLLSEEFSTKKLVDFLSKIPELEQVSEFEFKNKEIFPFVRLILIKAKDIDSWSENDGCSKTNLIPIVYSKEEYTKDIEKVLIRIASFLKWNLVNEETEDGIENYIVWKP